MLNMIRIKKYKEMSLFPVAQCTVCKKKLWACSNDDGEWMETKEGIRHDLWSCPFSGKEKIDETYDRNKG